MAVAIPPIDELKRRLFEAHDDEMLTVRECAVIARVAEKTIRRWYYAGCLTDDVPVRDHRSVRIRKGALLEFLQGRRGPL